MALVQEDVDTAIKVIVVGNGGVGKTSLIRRFCKGVFTDNYKKTIGVDFLEKEHYLSSLEQSVRLMVWDTAGQEEFDAITRSYYRGAGACILAFSTTDRQSFIDIDSWKTKVEKECGKDIAMVLIQNKVDLITDSNDENIVKPDEAEDLAKRLGLKFYRTCVKNNFNVKEVFDYLAELVLSKKPSGQSEEAVVGIQDIARRPSSASISSPNGAIGAKDRRDSSKPFQMKPSKQRTGGKKQQLSCSIL